METPATNATQEGFHRREEALNGIVRSIEQAMQEPVESPIIAEVVPDTTPEPEPVRPIDPPTRRYQAGVPYVTFRGSASRDFLLKSENAVFLRTIVEDVIKAEGPIHHDVLVQRLKQLHAVGRAGSNILANINSALELLDRGPVSIGRESSPFHRARGQEIKSFRLPSADCRRSIEQIAPEELALAILYVVEAGFGMVEESLPAAVGKLLGVERVHSNPALLIQAGVDDLVNRGLLRRSGSQVHLA